MLKTLMTMRLMSVNPRSQFTIINIYAVSIYLGSDIKFRLEQLGLKIYGFNYTPLLLVTLLDILLLYIPGVSAPLIGVSAPLVGASVPLIGASAPLIGVSAPLIGISDPLIDVSARLIGPSTPLIDYSL